MLAFVATHMMSTFTDDVVMDVLRTFEVDRGMDFFGGGQDWLRGNRDMPGGLNPGPWHFRAD